MVQRYYNKALEVARYARIVSYAQGKYKIVMKGLVVYNFEEAHLTENF